MVAPPLTARSWHTATLLGDGRLLVVGGRLGPGPDAELYDAQADAWRPTATQPVEGRAYHAATALLDGRVLVVGGTDSQGSFMASAEIYDPDSDRWTAAENLDYHVMAPQALRLPGGCVLVMGGWRYDEQQRDGCVTPFTRLYDPGTGAWAAGPDLLQARVGHTATVLNDGTVLVAGGSPSVFSVLATTECLAPDH